LNVDGPIFSWFERFEFAMKHSQSGSTGENGDDFFDRS